MATLKNAVTGVVVETDDETAAALDPVIWVEQKTSSKSTSGKSSKPSK